MRDPMRLVVQHRLIQWRHQMNSFAAGELGPRFKALALHQRAQIERGLHDRIPADTLAGIEIDYDAVGMFEVLDGRIPRVQLDSADLDEPKEAIQAVDPQARSLAALALLNTELVHGGRDLLGNGPL